MKSRFEPTKVEETQCGAQFGHEAAENDINVKTFRNMFLLMANAQLSNCHRAFGQRACTATDAAAAAVLGAGTRGERLFLS